MSIYYDKRSNRWCLVIRVDDKRIQVHSPEQQLLERMQSIIIANHLSYAKAKLLATDYRLGLIPAGYIGHKYLNPDLGYRVISTYHNKNGFIHTCYATPEDAWNDPCIQSIIATTGNKYADYNSYLSTVDAGKPWSIGGWTILRCKINALGKICVRKKVN